MVNIYLVAFSKSLELKYVWDMNIWTLSTPGRWIQPRNRLRIIGVNQFLPQSFHYSANNNVCHDNFKGAIITKI